MTARSHMSVPLVKETGHLQQNPYKNVPSNKGTPAHSCPPLYKKENSNLIWK